MIKGGHMASPGLEAVARAKQQGRWDVETVVKGNVQQLTELIASYPKAAANFQKMSPSAQRLYAGYYSDAKQDATRLRRLAKIVSLVEQNKKPMM